MGSFLAKLNFMFVCTVLDILKYVLTFLGVTVAKEFQIFHLNILTSRHFDSSVIGRKFLLRLSNFLQKNSLSRVHLYHRL